MKSLRLLVGVVGIVLLIALILPPAFSFISDEVQHVENDPDQEDKEYNVTILELLPYIFIIVAIIPLAWLIKEMIF